MEPSTTTTPVADHQQRALTFMLDALGLPLAGDGRRKPFPRGHDRGLRCRSLLRAASTRSRSSC